MPTAESELHHRMRAAVYRGNQQVVVEDVSVPPCGPGEILIRVQSCGICHTDLKKIEYDLLPAPRIFGHETAGVVAAVGEGVSKFAVGDRVVAFHHIPCSNCFYCQRRLYAQCAGYKRVGITAGFEPAGGGFAEYVRVMDWIVERGVEKIPDGVSFDAASFVEPVNTVLKGIEMAAPQPDELAVVMGQGPIGLLFTMILRHRGIRTLTSDTIASRRKLSEEFGALQSVDPRNTDVKALAAAETDGRGADVVFVATSVPGLVEQAVAMTRPGARIVLFAQTSDKERIELSGKDICMGERQLLGSYSADVDLQKQSADLVFSGALPVDRLVSHRFRLEEFTQAMDLALHPTPESLKIVIWPQR